MWSALDYLGHLVKRGGINWICERYDRSHGYGKRLRESIERLERGDQ